MPIEVFYSYSHKDSDLRDQLAVQLTQLVRDGLIVPWVDRCIMPGEEWSSEIDAHIHSAQIVLLLVSPDFLASDYCYGIELKTALERHERHEAIVIPIILRPCDWRSAPFAKLECLPRDAQAVTLWPNRDLVLSQIAQAIRETVVRFQVPKPTPADAPELSDQLLAKSRVIDAAMPAHIVKGRATELLVLIRLPDSTGLTGVLQNDDEAEAKPEDVRSKPFDVVFPLGPTGLPQPLKVTVTLTSPDFDPPSQSKNIFVPVDRDSQVCPFLLTPTKTGPLMVVIELMWEDAERGSRRLKTTCIGEAAEAPPKEQMVLVQMPVGREQTMATAAGAAPSTAPMPAPPPPSRVESLPDLASTAYSQYVLPKASSGGYPRSSGPMVQAPAVRKTSILSSNWTKAAMILCVATLGSTFFLVMQPNASSPTSKSYPTPAAPPPPMAATVALSKEIDSAAVKLNRSEAELKEAPAPVQTAIKEGQINLALAKAALAKGDHVTARQHLAKVNQINGQLITHQLQKHGSAP